MDNKISTLDNIENVKNKYSNDVRSFIANKKCYKVIDLFFEDDLFLKDCKDMTRQHLQDCSFCNNQFQKFTTDLRRAEYFKQNYSLSNSQWKKINKVVLIKIFNNIKSTILDQKYIVDFISDSLKDFASVLFSLKTISFISTIVFLIYIFKD